MMGSSESSPTPRPQIWWSNATFFVSVHLATLYFLRLFPPTAVPWPTLVLAYVMWQLAEFGITIGYHRLWSHRAFRASIGVRIVLAVLGSSGFQGSIKWWCLRHRLHHRFTDDPLHDPYAATRGLLYSHMGWIFFKPTYTRMELVDREDLDSDPVVQFQHKHYVPLALFFGFVLPPLIGTLWGDPLGAFVWGSLVARISVWHCTFFVNSLAHWDGLQPFSDEDTSRGNLATFGRLNKWRRESQLSCPWITAWDPSKWVILLLHRLGLVTGLRRARDADLREALAYMNHKHVHGIPPGEAEEENSTSQHWTRETAMLYVKERGDRCVVLLDGWLVDATAYQREHPGGASILRKYSLNPKSESESFEWRDASWAFHGGLNNHSRAATKRMKELRIAKIKNLPSSAEKDL